MSRARPRLLLSTAAALVLLALSVTACGSAPAEAGLPANGGRLPQTRGAIVTLATAGITTPCRSPRSKGSYSRDDLKE